MYRTAKLVKEYRCRDAAILPLQYTKLRIVVIEQGGTVTDVQVVNLVEGSHSYWHGTGICEYTSK